MAADIPTFEHEEQLPEGDGVAIPQELLPAATLHGPVVFVHTPTGATRRGVVVAFERHDGDEWVVVRYG